MSAPESAADRPAPGGPNWEAFYRDYRKPGYVAGFEITTKLGGGMFGLVFRARKQSIGKDYAIKFLQVDDTEVRRAVLAELEQVKWFAQIDHPNLVSIEDRGEVDGIPFLVMSFAGTETLRDRIGKDGVPPSPEVRDELLRWFVQCCRGLSALHERSLVHFDVKPANVFLKGPVARLGDYGLSKLVTHSRGSLTTGRGTPYYMAPEMLQRRGDHRSDIYSAGVMLYEILCSRVPFTGDSEWEVLRQHETKAPELPPHLSAVERSVLQRCLQKDPAARFQSVQDLIAALGAAASAGAAPGAARAGGSTVGWAVPPPLPRDLPPPLPVEPPPPVDAHLAGLGKASREAAHHAKFVARHAVNRARIAARRAAARARAGSLRVLERVRAAHGHRRPPAESPPPVRRGRGVFGTLALVAIVAVGLFFVFILAAHPVRIDVDAPVPYASVSAPRMVIPTGTVYGSHIVPARYQEVVTRGIPSWVSLHDRDPERARKVLLAHVRSLRDVAPLAEDSNVGVELPSFTLMYDFVPFVRAQQVAFDALLRGDEYSEDVAESLAARGHIAIVAAADLLARIQWTRLSDVERAARLHRFLGEATGCRDIEWHGSAHNAAAVGRANRHLGVLWVWFANEFARDERTWNAFRAMFPPR